MLIGYMRVSSVDDRQSVDLQRDALLAAGVDERHLYSDKASGARDDRSGLKTCLEYLKEGDTLIVWKLDRLGRSLANLLTIITDLKVRGVAFQSLTEQMDTTTPHGELLFSLFGALAQYERAYARAGDGGTGGGKAPGQTRRSTAEHRRGDDRADHGRTQCWCKQSVSVPVLQGAPIDPHRHARSDWLDGASQGLTRCPAVLS